MLQPDDRPNRTPVYLALLVVGALVLTWVVTGTMRQQPMDVVRGTSPETGISTQAGGTVIQPAPWYTKWFGRQSGDSPAGGQVSAGGERKNPYYRSPAQHQAASEAAAPLREQARANLKKYMGDKLSEEQIDSMVRSR